mgnify:CR=1 FL=1
MLISKVYRVYAFAFQMFLYFCKIINTGDCKDLYKNEKESEF